MASATAMDIELSEIIRPQNIGCLHRIENPGLLFMSMPPLSAAAQRAGNEASLRRIKEKFYGIAEPGYRPRRQRNSASVAAGLTARKSGSHGLTRRVNSATRSNLR